MIQQLAHIELQHIEILKDKTPHYFMKQSTWYMTVDEI